MSQTLTTTITTTHQNPSHQEDGKEEKEKENDPPTLHTTLTTDQNDLIAALRLLSDSVAQQRQLAARALLANPLALAPLLALLAAAYKLTYHAPADLPLFLTTAAGCVAVFLTAVRWVCAGYIEEAERVGTWRWLRQQHQQQQQHPAQDKNRSTSKSKSKNTSHRKVRLQSEDADTDGDEDAQVVLITRFGERIIGALVLCGQTQHASGGGEVRGVIRGWTVERRYRGFGVGRELLEAAVGVCREREWTGPEFDAAHANAKRVVPGWLDRGFEERERRARRVLEGVKSAGGS
ncbi:acetyltransferase, GNAT family [Aspergillus clavatus NRRL 1]|uniref:Acetyltransferase, GNAT family family n=1 Tax=Aspergillus clavatus (strain ATCC 1007 / CBS 513.65 / DSM 816 / NCTC 3887 / NRRL 1 / QM 1276 / 107) TaxID=344612 RepID=A1C9B1_ASPCL|nr:acetyltransferase, GNAT family [Aspergillus clavatus NRRL 1]EAW13435.1 acetyltransferase, GNAT family family [Aspergillus clavatus NRRL 1]